MIKYITQSEAGSWRRCRRQWWLQHHRGLRIKEEYQRPTALTTGILFHDCMQAFYEGRSWRDTIAHALNDMPENNKEAWTKEAELVFTMMEGYEEWLEETGEDAGLTVLAVEKLLEAPLGTAFDVEVVGRGKADLVVMNDGWFGFMDHKSTARSVSYVETSSANTEQFRFYAALLDDIEEGQTVNAWVNVARKVKRTARSTPPFYARIRQPVNLAEIASIRQRMLAIAGDIIAAEMRLAEGEHHNEVVYPSPGMACQGCTYEGVCPMFDDGSNVEGFIESWYDERDPMARYKKDA